LPIVINRYHYRPTRNKYTPILLRVKHYLRGPEGLPGEGLGIAAGGLDGEIGGRTIGGGIGLG
jgi:hypothetical protein